eukprot:CAMPEP_0168392978 /NCGR_PEP_ID=MMETSP0228-20121227/18779_1 /TAXON_ID=133427 /ORGANISM="Protoceratium reticulatum, Strain CCCM 535 (=CCMP 1889)" /LENGTH=171 /DNA_ID=CAMNT_0008406341 /DNA_START=454 /DNA_END=970 /DNA_ORIENTATION=+
MDNPSERRIERHAYSKGICEERVNLVAVIVQLWCLVRRLAADAAPKLPHRRRHPEVDHLDLHAVAGAFFHFRHHEVLQREIPMNNGHLVQRLDPLDNLPRERIQQPLPLGAGVRARGAAAPREQVPFRCKFCDDGRVLVTPIDAKKPAAVGVLHAAQELVAANVLPRQFCF